jgi:hypothetical protein
VTFGLGNRCSIRLSYGTGLQNVYFKMLCFERARSCKVTLRACAKCRLLGGRDLAHDGRCDHRQIR